MMHELKGVEVITRHVLRDIVDRVFNATEAESLSYLIGLVCGGRSDCSIHEAMLER